MDAATAPCRRSVVFWLLILVIALILTVVLTVIFSSISTVFAESDITWWVLGGVTLFGIAFFFNDAPIYDGPIFMLALGGAQQIAASVAPEYFSETPRKAGTDFVIGTVAYLAGYALGRARGGTL